ncbi:TRAP transporter substrate-binding protein [Bacillus sp. B15-48]|uniref:TRAP transporter substrate-binding protein n=1 Tax=Bacillus sp. B15-48 TaxID=1548601 RepID=UPI00193F7B01|nr:TRAP transporter substrate-binding protein [Bacillus sp. B15-48]MBM4761089.1 DctP family TRAP transporter solute-binding subunit [Bacillus sp. B15-48]
MKKRNILLALLLVFSVVLAACSSAPSSSEGSNDSSGSGSEGSEDKTYVIKMGHAASQDHFAQDSAEKFKELVEANSEGKITVEIYPNGQLGGEREMVEAIQLGNLTMAFPSSAVLVAFSPSMAVWDLPYLFKDHETAHRVLDGEVGQEILDSLSDKGIKGLAYWENGFRHLTNNKKPVANVDDMKGLKIRTLESPMQIKFWSATGANATPIAFTELYAALQQGTVDAQETPLSLMYSMKFFEVQKYLSLTGHLYSPWPVLINQSFYNNLPEDLQKVVMDATVETRDFNRQLSKQDEDASLELLTAEGMEYTELTDEQKQGFQEAMSTVYEDVKGQIGEEIFDKLMGEVGL